MENRTNQPFTEALGTMLRERSGDRMGRFPLAPFIAQIGDKTGLNYEYIRLMLRDQRTLRTDVIEAAAEALGIPPLILHRVPAALRQGADGAPPDSDQ